MRGLILAGGHGTRLHPITKVINKHLLMIYDKPMIFYPIMTLRDAGIKDIVLTLGDHDCERFYDLLGSGKKLGVNLTYHYHGEPKGIAYAINSALDEMDTEQVVVHLGDNIFTKGITGLTASVFKYDWNGVIIKEVSRKDALRYGCIHYDPCKLTEYGWNPEFTEKEEIPRTHILEGIMLGCYVFNVDDYKSTFSKALPSVRGEYEITDIFSMLHQFGKDIIFHKYEDDWFDCGVFEDLYQASKWRRSCI